MTHFDDLFDYNAWANAQVLAVTDQMSEEQLEREMPELGGSALGLLDHLAQVEAAFLAVMSGRERAARTTRPYAAVRTALEANAEGYRAAMPGFLERLDERFELTWFGRSFTIEQGLLQVATHSVQPRAGICAGIALAGKEAPLLDYIAWCAQFR